MKPTNQPKEKKEKGRKRKKKEEKERKRKKKKEKERKRKKKKEKRDTSEAKLGPLNYFLFLNGDVFLN